MEHALYYYAVLLRMSKYCRIYQTQSIHTHIHTRLTVFPVLSHTNSAHIPLHCTRYRLIPTSSPYTVRLQSFRADFYFSKNTTCAIHLPLLQLITIVAELVSCKSYISVRKAVLRYILVSNCAVKAYCYTESGSERVSVKFCLKAGKTATETVEMVHAAYGDEALTRSNVFRGYGRFREGREDAQYDPRSGRPEF